MRYLITLSAVLIAITLSTPTTEAALVAQGCKPGAFQQFDMAGVYVNQAGPMRVELFPCGGSTILWDNAYGRHVAVYASTEPLPGGGVIAVGMRPDPAVGYLDNCYTVVFKPAEPGYIEAYTLSPYGQFIGMYRLKKV